ncbi:u3 small nucleolar interacting protein 2, putative, partial [Ichthyophthirius multifiliis]
NKKFKLTNGKQLNKKNKKQEKEDPNNEEIDSDEIDSQSVSDLNQKSIQEGTLKQKIKVIKTIKKKKDQEEEETAERKRLRLAQQILNKAKKQNQKKTGDFPDQTDDSFDDGEDKQSDNDSFVGVHKGDKTTTDAITKALQNEILKKRQLFYTHYIDQVYKNWQTNNQSYSFNTLKGHKRCITCIEFCPSGQYLYTASKDASIIKWDLKNNNEKIFLVREKTTESHKDEIYSISINHLSKYLISGSKDKTIKIWDLQKMSLLKTLTGHRQAVIGVKFGINSNIFCSVSADLQFKMWDASEKVFLDTFFGHKGDVNYIDAITAEHFISSGFDRQVIIWKTEQQSQLVYEGHDFSIDIVKAINQEYFITGSQDGNIGLWFIKKKKPVYILQNAHGGYWITSIGNIYNTDFFCSGSYNQQINVYKLSLQDKKFDKLYSIPCEGIINDIKISIDCNYLAYTQGDEHKLGRWIVSKKTKNLVKYVKLL